MGSGLKLSQKKITVDFVFVLHYIRQQFSTLIVHFYFLQVVLSLLFIAWKVAKAPGTRKDVIKRVKHQACLSVLQRAITSYLKSSRSLVDNTAFFASRAVQTTSALRTTNCWRYCRFASKFRSCKQHPSVKEGAKAHSFGELKLPSSQTLLARNGATWTFLLIFGWCGPSSVSHSPSAST